MVIHGHGDQYWMTKDYEDKRNLALEKRSRYDEETLEKLDVAFPQGGGGTYWRTFLIWQHICPTSTKYKKKKQINMRMFPNIM